MVGVSSPTAPNGNGDRATVETRFWCQYVGIRTASEVLQAGDEVADGAVAVSPSDEFAQTVRGGLKRVGHVRDLEQRERRKCLRPLDTYCMFSLKKRLLELQLIVFRLQLIRLRGQKT